MTADSGPTFLEFFAGGGMAGLGLAPGFSCAFANDIDAMKCRTYAANFGAGHLVEGDIWRLRPDTVPTADLAWASFPCQDLSLAGARRGLNAPRSGAFWGFWNLIEALEDDDRAPPTLCLENVSGLLSSRGGRDFTTLVETLANRGYRVGALLMDAAHFTPQSRPRLFVIAHKGRIPEGLEGPVSGSFHPPALKAAADRLPHEARLAWVWWRLPEPPRRNTRLDDLTQRDLPDSAWRDADALSHLLSLMSPLHRARLDAAIADGGYRVGAVYRRIRIENGRRVQRAEIRYDGLAGCLRTPAGGSSRQLLLVSEGGNVRLRPMTPREAARLMGVPDDFVLPARDTAALKVLGDGVCVPVVRWLGDHLLRPLAAGRSLARAA